MERRSFQRLVVSALQDLPEEFRRRLENVEILVEDWPPGGRGKRRRGRQGSSLLGLYHGYPLKERSSWYGNVLPDRIVIYRGPIESSCRDEKEIRRLVKEVVLHEIGHYFGLEEGELRAVEEEESEGVEPG